MRLWILSDLHLELQEEIPLSIPDADVCILAGDITAPLDASFAWAVDRILGGHMPVILVPGNHEFYGDSVMGGIYRGLKAYAYDPRVHLLVNDCVIINGVRFVGSTLWTDYALDASRASPAARDSDIAWAMRNSEGLLQDHQQIARDDGSWVRWSPADARATNKTARVYLESVLEVPHEGPTVVVTHHAPSPLSIAPRYLGSPLNPAFASDLSATILRYRPDVWVHGHVHHSAGYVLGETQVVCNPRGVRKREPGLRPGARTRGEEVRMLREWERKAVDGYVRRAFGTADYEVVGRAPMMWVGWEADTDALLLRLGDGRQAWFVLHCVDVAPDAVAETLRQRLVAYRQAIAETEKLLRLAGEM